MSSHPNVILMKTLREFGLSEKEVAIYLALLQADDTSVQTIAKSAGVNDRLAGVGSKTAGVNAKSAGVNAKLAVVNYKSAGMRRSECGISRSECEISRSECEISRSALTPGLHCKNRTLSVPANKTSEYEIA